MFGNDADIESILEFGVYHPDDPIFRPRRAMLAIGETLGIIDGMELMKQVFDAYEAEHGIKKARKLHASWDTAAGSWYD